MTISITLLFALGSWLLFEDVVRGLWRYLFFSSKTTYRYKPLKHHRQFRLLFLHPGAGDDEISCGLELCSLDADLRYEALSYVWGNQKQTRPIRCGDGQIEVTFNLHSALQHLRYTDKNRIIWADALCINQSDLRERNSQVQLMGDIYSAALRTLIWLGEATPDVAKAFESLTEIRNYFPSRSCHSFNAELMAGKSLELDPDTFIREQAQLANTGHRNIFVAPWEPIIALMERPWFRRKWIIQEAVKARDRLLICGKLSLSWTIFEDTVMYTKITGLMPLMGPLLANELAKVAIQNIATIAYISHEVDSLSNLLYLSRDFHCTDPRDNIIALLGLASDVKATSGYLRPDYRARITKTFHRCALWYILELKSLEFLSCGCAIPGSNLKGLPSWVPDFSRSNGQLGNPLSDRDFTAALDVPLEARFSRCQSVLHIKGKELDEVSITGPLLNMSMGAFKGRKPEMKERDRFMREQREWLLKTRDVAGPNLSSRRLEELVRTLTWNGMVSNYSDIVPMFFEYLQLFENFTTLSSDGWFDRFFEIGQTFETLIGSFSTNRRLCCTTNGHLGSLPGDTKVGDKICLFHGGRMAYVIRSCNNGKHRFVGECYLDGYMYGAGVSAAEGGSREFSLI